MQPTLVILAAGLGTRFGGNKQIETIGPNGETIMDYSVYDALKAGFGKVVFVIQDSFKDEFMAAFNPDRFNHLIQVKYVFQELNKLPAGFFLPTGRTKPWGTNHALMMAQDKVSEPFAAINADDFYGREAYLCMGDFLRSVSKKNNQYCVMGYDVVATLVESGGTSRAECVMDADNYLTFIEERTAVQSVKGKITGLNMNNEVIELNDNSIVSMNFWGFTTDYFRYCHQYFKQFLTHNINSATAEFLIPSVVNDLIKKQIVNVKVLNSGSTWFGLTYQKDKTFVVEKLMRLIQAGIYPAKLWS